MAKTVSSAFTEFMRNTVNLESQKVEQARRSRDFLKSKISNFDDFSHYIVTEILITAHLHGRQKYVSLMILI